TPDGYITLQRLPQGGNLPLFNELYSAEPVWVGARQNTWIDGASAGISIHLLPQRQHPPSPADLDNMYIDIGATAEAEVRASGADILSPIALQRKFYEMGDGEWTTPAIGDRFGIAALVDVLRNLDRTKLTGSVTFAFVTQQWAGARGLQRIIYENRPDELIYVGRCMRPPALAGQKQAQPSFQRHPGDGVLVATENPGTLNQFAQQLKQLGSDHNLKVDTDYSAPLLPGGGYMLQPKLPERTVHLSVATDWPSTPAEVLQSSDVASLASLLELYLGSAPVTDAKTGPPLPEPPSPPRPRIAPSVDSILQRLIETYAASEHEGNMRAAVTALLPPWAKPTTDNAGNLVLHVGSSSAKPSERIVFAAHMDEIGFEVRSVMPDGRLELKDEGGGVPAYFLGHVALVHSANSMHPGVLELPEGWDKPDFQWPRGRGQAVHMDVGAKNPEDVARLGIKVGDFVTVPKKYRTLLGRKVSARALDDRVGCTALVSAVWALGATEPKMPGRDITFVWSTREELGLFGAAGAAKNMAEAGKTPGYVFAVDTFVSADSPLESKRFGDAKLGRGFVVRAIDNSNIVPHKLVEKVVSIARANNIAAQYGVTGGGNDGAAFLMYGSTDVALGWPLRYSHSQAEVVDVRDVDALGKIIAALARSW
ncbi:MAG TPA: M20/M25/M40 family metallo-hydrolase, partial [Terriglobales bacterium]|nr:M20/M25/M40 family metallo-hydrolase [Terriglobales bacterium]